MVNFCYIVLMRQLLLVLLLEYQVLSFTNNVLPSDTFEKCYALLENTWICMVKLCVTNIRNACTVKPHVT